MATKTPQGSTPDFYSYRLDLRVSGTSLPLGSFLRIFQRTFFTCKNWILFAATEVIEDNINPQFMTEIHLQYIFSVQQEIRIEVMKTSDNELYGAVEFKFANLLNAANQTLVLPFRKELAQPNDPESSLIIKVDNGSECMDEVRLELGASFFKSFVFKPKTYFTIWRLEDDQSYSKILQSLPVDSSSLPIWPQVQIKVSDLCKKDFSRVVRIVVHQVPRVGQEKILGHAELTIHEIFKDMIKTFNIVKFSRKAEKNFMKKQIGKLFVQHKEIIRDYQFIDYLFEGLDISSALAVDLSRNGLRDSAESEDNKTTEDAFSCIVDILAPYNLNKTVSCFGFGARFLTEEPGKVQPDCFILGKQSDHMNFINSEAVRQAYGQTLNSNILSRTDQTITNIVKSIVKVFRKDLFFSSNLRYYTISLVLKQVTGDIKELVDYVSSLSQEMPLSLFLIGVGEDSFSELQPFNVFNKPDTQKDSKGNILDASTINFLKFDAVDNGGGELAKDLLKVIPSGVTNFLQKAKERPTTRLTDLPKKSSNISNLARRDTQS